MVEGHAPNCVFFRRQDNRPVPLDQLCWSPSPKGEDS
jgi:hypothetical protein